MALFLFADAISKDKEIQIFNDGEMIRDFTYIDDIVEGYLGSQLNPQNHILKRMQSMMSHLKFIALQDIQYWK